MGFSRQESWSGLPFPSPVDHLLSDLSTMTCPSWVAPHGMAQFHWVRQGCGSVIRWASFLWLWFQSVCPLMPSQNTYCLTLLPVDKREGKCISWNSKHSFCPSSAIIKGSRFCSLPFWTLICPFVKSKNWIISPPQSHPTPIFPYSKITKAKA